MAYQFMTIRFSYQKSCLLDFIKRLAYILQDQQALDNVAFEKQTESQDSSLMHHYKHTLVTKLQHTRKKDVNKAGVTNVLSVRLCQCPLHSLEKHCEVTLHQLLNLEENSSSSDCAEKQNCI